MSTTTVDAAAALGGGAAPAASGPLAIDSEAALLCALLHTGDTAEVTHITSHLEPSDFRTDTYSHLFGVISDLAAAGQPHTAPRVLATLTDAGRLAGHQGARLADALREIALLGTPTVGLRSMALDVARAGYRRAFRAAVAAQDRASRDAPTDDLFELMCEQGRLMREHTHRLAALHHGQPATHATPTGPMATVA